MLLSLNFKQPHDTIHKVATDICYKNAVFGIPAKKYWASKKEVLKLMNQLCQSLHYTKLTIIIDMYLCCNLLMVPHIIKKPKYL